MLIASQSHAFEYSNLCEVMKTALIQLIDRYRRQASSHI
ncbi:hypothetical protein METHPM2_1490001 [Pseudomonas sp. PM2]